MNENASEAALDQLLSPRIREIIEQTYYLRVNTSMTLEEVAKDPTFLDDPIKHLALYTDHGIIHMRDVAFRMLDMLDIVPGVKVAERPRFRLDSMRSYGCLIAYVHDIGMSDQNPFGRLMHAQFAAQEAFGTVFDEVVDILWAENVGNLAWRVLQLTSAGVFDGSPQRILRELVSLAYAHSKSAVPVEALNSPRALRDVMCHAVGTPLSVLYPEKLLLKSQTDDERALHGAELSAASTDEAFAAHRGALLDRHYDDFAGTAFAWLEATDVQAQEFITDVIDTIRCLRCADALRQRGTQLRTSGNYQILIDQNTANAVYALHDADGRTFLLEGDNPINAGEANLADAVVTRKGDLRVSFYRGRFGSDDAVTRAARNAAVVVDDVQGDVVESFVGAGGPMDPRQSLVLLEQVEDNPGFAALVAQMLTQRAPVLENRVRCVSALLHAPLAERARFLAADPIEWDLKARKAFLDNVAARGFKTNHIDPEAGFAEARLAHLSRGEILTETGAHANFVYIALTDGLRGQPIGGYAPFLVKPWEPLGITGVIRGDVRNATVLADDDTDVVIIPKDAYLTIWHRNYTPAEFSDLIRTGGPSPLT